MRADGSPSDGRAIPSLRLERVSALDTLREEWDELAERSGNVFASWEFVSLWWQYFGAGKRPVVSACRDADGRLVAVLPLCEERRALLRLLRFAGHGPGDELGPICAPADRPAAIAALRDELARLRYDVFVGEQLPAGDAWPGRTVSREGSPVLRFGGRSWDDILAAKSRNFREQVRRRERKLAREHDLVYSAGSGDLERDLDRLFALHAARWGARRTSYGVDERFQRALAVATAARSWLRLWFLDVDGDTVAAWQGFRFAGAESYYQAGRDPAWDGSSVGFVLLAHTIRSAIDDGAGEYRFLRGAEEYKYRFADDDPGLVTVAAARGPVGIAAVRVVSALRAARRRRRETAPRGGH